MMRIFAASIASVLFAVPAFAQQQQSAQPETRAVQLTGQQLAIVGKALGKLPFEESADLIFNLQKQIQAQEPKPTPPK